jgi:hypothetical protein
LSRHPHAQTLRSRVSFATPASYRRDPLQEIPVEDFVDKMVEKVGIDKATAEKVIAFLKDHTDDALQLLQSSGLKDKLPGGLGKMF